MGNAAHAAGRSTLVVDANTGQDLIARDADRPLYPASLTKMMTLYLAFEQIEARRLSYGAAINMSEACAARPPSNLDMGADASLSLRNAVLAIIVKSANDVACAVGEHIGGSEERFAALMTAKARQLGMRATTFRNASGLPDPGQVTTARDMATLALRLTHDFPQHYKLFATREVTINGSTHRTHNSLLRSFEGTDGIKTGYTRASGFNLVSSVRRGQKHVIGVVFGGLTAAQRNAHMRTVITQGLGRAKAMAAPLLVRRPMPVAEPTRVAEKAPVPLPVAPAPPISTETQASPEAPDPALAAVPQTATALRPAPRPMLVARPATAVVTTAHAGKSASVPTRLPVPKRMAAATTVAPQPAAERAAALATVPTPGRPPGTLQDQMTATAPATPPVVAPTRTAAAAPAAAPRPAGLGGPAASGPFHVQIGAYSNEAEAQRQLSAISGRTGALFTGHAPLTMPFTKADQRFVRARFAGFSEAKAQAACQSLKQLKIECVVMRAE